MTCWYQLSSSNAPSTLHFCIDAIRELHLNSCDLEIHQFYCQRLSHVCPPIKYDILYLLIDRVIDVRQPQPYVHTY
jgi:hypothetical protein